MSKTMLIIVIIISFLFLGIMGTGLFVMWNKLSSLDRVVNPVSEEESEDANKEEEDQDVIGPTYALDTFIVNLADEGGKRYLRVTMNLELKDTAVSKELEKRLPQIRNAVLMLLPTKRHEDIRNIEGKIGLRDEIITRLNGLFKEESITNLYFTEFVVQ
ncbi:MAG: flagellar basal body-associated FliL family protein [Deltaproteobacteria bacterium]|nr:flagellar basal body-associated FliL family protein [Deltaproteobacteria bacterium]MBW1736385.1 flagellar basal body-associated FliL family protein [Deltaproteobacteria bacterium]MBW1908124.1 flagellar basal body-associated FliL family protein [Deltaproteobacteria bacterium]MBW2032203.1 flagellar basal body-associated FliL family protein [Deltaproteobacteria bacterium]MBW2113776.1 flagellar basal body-associated FliL family protein [Deltaproteobacteria bacterium]